MEADAHGLRATLVMRRRIGAASAVTLRWSLDAESPILRVDVELDWHEPESLLKLVFPTGYRGTHARCGAPFGSVLRPQQPGATAAEAMWEIPASRHVTVLDDAAQHGFSVLTEAKYAFSVRDGAIGVSLVRSPRHTGYDAGHAKAYPAALSRVRVDSPFTDQGRHEIRLALARFAAATPRSEQPAALAETLFAETVAYRGTPVQAPGFRGLTGGESLVPCWAQPLTKSAWVLRLHEVAGASGTARLELAPGWSARKIDLRGQSLGPRLTRGALAFRAHEIVSVRLERA
jgi:alpha-mannosidase